MLFGFLTPSRYDLQNNLEVLNFSFPSLESVGGLFV